jgi:hypothetical protein
MKKLQIVLLALFAVSAFGAVIAASASAEETLLAEWLANGVGVTTLLPVEISGAITLKDNNSLAGDAAVLCEGILKGSVGPNGEDEITEVLTLGGGPVGELPTGPSLKCSTVKTCAAASAESPIEVWPVGLPILTLLFLDAVANLFLILAFSHAAGVPFGYELLCLVLGINAEDTCTSEDSEIEVVNDPDTLDAAIPAGATFVPFAKCSQKGGLSGENIADELASILDTDGVTLITVSSE